MIRVLIPSYQSVEIVGRNKRYHTYRIEVHTPDGLVSQLDRRYSDFLILHKEIRRRLGTHTPFFPPKKVRNSSVRVLESRRTGLELYLQRVLLFSPLPREVLGFLNLPGHRGTSAYEEKPRRGLEDGLGLTDSGILNQPAAGFMEDPYIESDTSSNISDTITRGVLDALYNL